MERKWPIATQFLKIREFCEKNTAEKWDEGYEITKLENDINHKPIGGTGLTPIMIDAMDFRAVTLPFLRV